jgi:ubiquinone/menaquinone biosynthesis C-methylase UbiE
MTLKTHKRDWEDLGNVDPLWAILSVPEKKFGNWNVNDFILTGEQEISAVMDFATQLGYPSGREVVLDFGCGVGRLSRALAKYFQHCYGIDISGSMVIKAKELNKTIGNCSFIINTEEHLRIFSDNYFDMIYTNIVLQHVPSKAIIKSYISEFIRVIKNNGLIVFQLPSYVPFKNRIQLRRRLYVLLRTLGFNERFLFEKMKLTPIRMNYVPEKEMIEYIDALGANVLKVQSKSYANTRFQSNTYYITKM